jgi:hypothetical protein
MHGVTVLVCSPKFYLWLCELSGSSPSGDHQYVFFEWPGISQLRIPHPVTSDHRNACRSSCKVPVVIVWFQPKLECFNKILWNFQIPNLIKIHSAVLSPKTLCMQTMVRQLSYMLHIFFLICLDDLHLSCEEHLLWWTTQHTELSPAMKPSWLLMMHTKQWWHLLAFFSVKLYDLHRWNKLCVWISFSGLFIWGVICKGNLFTLCIWDIRYIEHETLVLTICLIETILLISQNKCVWSMNILLEHWFWRPWKFVVFRDCSGIVFSERFVLSLFMYWIRWITELASQVLVWNF